jgi:ABC-type polysaccharide/polyol phosphate transport system ATPase subunit
VHGVSKQFSLPLDRGSTLQYRFSHPITTSRHRKLEALNGVSFSVEPGEFLGITGPNGCGKSTLLKVLSRIYQPDRGSVTINGRVSPFLELGVGFKEELTARENVFLGGAILGLTRSQLERRVHDVLDFAELHDFADQKLKNYSSGMVVRLAFSVAMLADADILLMDEVLAVGDARFQEKCFDVFAEYKRSGRTIVLVTHDLGALDLYCDRVLLLQNGRLIADGPSNEVTAEYRRIVSAMSEYETSDSSPSSGGLSPSRRWGSRHVEVTAVELLGSDGHPHRSFLSGQTMSVLVHYVINRPVDAFVCGLGFLRSDGHWLAGPNTRTSHYGVLHGPVGAHGTVRYKIESLPLLAASYLLTVNMSDGHLNNTYDHLENVLHFHVADERGRSGVIDLGGKWEHEQRDPPANDQ